MIEQFLARPGLKSRGAFFTAAART